MILFLAIMASLAANAQYFSTKIGAEFVYVNYDEDGQSVSAETLTVKKAQRRSHAANAEYIVKIVNQKSKNNTSYSRLVWNYAEGCTSCCEDLMYGIYIDNDSDPDVYNDEIMYALRSDNKYKGDNSFSICDDAKGGESMPDRSYSYVTSLKKKEITISGATYLNTETVESRAKVGGIKCLKITYLQQTKTAMVKKETYRVNEWYAKGIGLVKREVYNLKGELQAKTLLTRISD